MEIKKRETRKEVVGRMKARDQDGKERWIEEVIPFARTQQADGSWGEWQQSPNQFWTENIFCNRTSDTEFVPIMTDDVLTLVDEKVH